ncbi:MAG: LON peptidase substrate-binding domain-containing protein [Acidobacteriota bacterium]
MTTRELPLFPLPVVLLPTALLPLHIFEERYKLMIRTCLEGDKMFGITYHTEREGWPPAPERVGAVAQIIAVVPLEDERMNILTVGVARYRVSKYLEMEPYLKAQVELFQDEPEEKDPTPLMEEVKRLYERASSALRELNEEQLPAAELPESPEEFSFAVAARMKLQYERKQHLLELRSTRMRLNRLRQHINKIADQYELRAELHSRAKRNGHGLPSVLDQLKNE